MRLHNLSSSRLQVERFNADNPIGKPVTYWPNSRRAHVTITLSQASIYCNTPVVWLAGTGRVPLDRVRPQ